ncbi:DUF7545 family protein [Haloglomus litoreum]|uniref:DUF7545 family protein n=1 Tax=Haloglomus litoreum TaxID=3034026 RepID=UPI0023E85E1E|nr:hypothetical protein [Haloglomus sp. DT116]
MSTDKSDAVTLTIDGPDGEDQVTLPSGLLEMLAEGEESAAEVVGDLAMFGCAQRIHATVHHSEGGVDEELEAIEETTMDLFEERFGATYGELTGHQH